MTAKLGIRAWVVVDPNREDYDVVYAESRGKARTCAELDSTDFVDREARRAPELDQYLGKGGPTQADLRTHGWWFICSGEGCCKHVYPEEGGVHDGRVYCDACLLKTNGGDR